MSAPEWALEQADKLGADLYGRHARGFIMWPLISETGVTASEQFAHALSQARDKALEEFKVTGAMIDTGAHALEMGTDLDLSWEEYCSLSELVLRATASAIRSLKGKQ